MLQNQFCRDQDRKCKILCWDRFKKTFAKFHTLPTNTCLARKGSQSGWGLVALAQVWLQLGKRGVGSCGCVPVCQCTVPRKWSTRCLLHALSHFQGAPTLTPKKQERPRHRLMRKKRLTFFATGAVEAKFVVVLWLPCSDNNKQYQL